MVLAGAFLLARRAVIGVLEVKHDGRGGSVELARKWSTKAVVRRERS